jgi:alkylhydroperoxidase family enzyme
MARIDYPSVESTDAQQVEEQVRSQRGGRLPPLYRMQLYNPAIADGWLRLGTAVRYKSELDAPTRELAICLVARATRVDYEWQPHRRLAIEEGFSEAQIDGILDWRSGQFDNKQRAVLALTEGLTRDVQVDDATFEAVRKHLTPRQLFELVTTVAYYNMLARFLAGLQIDVEA